MANLPVYDAKGSKVGTYEIDTAVLSDSINKQLLHDAVVMYQANLRQGSHKTKTRSEVRGSTKKMYRQKGTGNARAGSKRSGMRRGGGHIFARRNRDYSYRLPRKAVQLATRMAIASKIQDAEIVVVDDLKFDQPKTREMVAVLNSLGLAGQSTLIAIESHDVNAYKSSRNIAGVTMSPVADLNALCVLAPRRMLVTRGALDAIRERSKKAARPRQVESSPVAVEE